MTAQAREVKPAYVVQVTVGRNLLLTANHRLTRYPAAYRTQQLRLLGFAETRRQLGRLRLTGRWRCDVDVAWPNRIRRDAANIQPTLKALIDGVVDAQLLPDDSDQYLVGPFPRRHPELFKQRDMACRLWLQFTPDPSKATT